MEFYKRVLTQKGLSLLAKAQSGQCKIEFTKAATGNGEYSSLEMEDLQSVDKLKSVKQTLNFTGKPIVVDADQVRVCTLVNNDDLTEGYHFLEYGIYAHDPAEGEILYALSVILPEKADWIAPIADAGKISISIHTYLKAANADSVEIYQSNFDYVSQEVFDGNAQDTAEKLEGVNQKLSECVQDIGKKFGEVDQRFSEYVQDTGEKFEDADQRLLEYIRDTGEKFEDANELLEKHAGDMGCHIEPGERGKWDTAINNMQPVAFSGKASDVSQDSNNRFVTDVQVNAFNDKYTKIEIDNLFSAHEMDVYWKKSVPTYADIAKTYTNPKDGWTVNVDDTDMTYRYTGTQWIAISANAIPLADASLDGRMSSSDYRKLKGVEEGANKYIHPGSHDPSIVSQNANNRFVTDAQIAVWNAKQNAMAVDAAINSTSTNPVQNKAINAALNGKSDTGHTHLYAGSATAGGSASKAIKLEAAKTLTIGNAGKAFDGSANVSWSLADIGAASSSHTHNYAGASSSGGAAAKAIILENARAIKIGNKSLDFNGSAPLTYTLAEIGASAAEHTHTNYAVLVHSHDNIYSKTDHAHTNYSVATHNHDNVYSKSDHAHANYAATTHNHDNVYSKSDHAHANYAATTHNHDNVYSKSDHAHANYAATTHNHDSTYSKTSHTHSYLPLAGGKITGDVTIASEVYFTDMNGINTSKTPIAYADGTRVILGGGGGAVDIWGQATTFTFGTTIFRPDDSGNVNIGNSTYRFKQLFAANATISTSDRNKKRNINAISSKYEALFMRIKPVTYEFKSENDTGNRHDRIHIGAISQDIENSMEEVGLTPIEFGGFCKDVKYETVKHVHSKYKSSKEDEDSGDEEIKIPILDEEGNVTYDYSLRYNEFIMLNTHMIQKSLKRIEELERTIIAQQDSISKLSVRLEALETD